jgi:uncharacterized protein (DUF433 family)
MVAAYSKESAIVRTERGLTISGTRTSLYDVMDFLKVQYPPQLIRDKLNLTDIQIQTALSYIEEHQIQVEAEYNEVLQTRAEIRQYWDDRNREHFSRLSKKQRTPEQQALLAKLEQQKAERAALKA